MVQFRWLLVMRMEGGCIIARKLSLGLSPSAWMCEGMRMKCADDEYAQRGHSHNSKYDHV